MAQVARLNHHLLAHVLLLAVPMVMRRTAQPFVARIALDAVRFSAHLREVRGGWQIPRPSDRRRRGSGGGWKQHRNILHDSERTCPCVIDRKAPLAMPRGQRPRDSRAVRHSRARCQTPAQACAGQRQRVGRPRVRYSLGLHRRLAVQSTMTRR